jgi:hypothetical protein
MAIDLLADYDQKSGPIDLLTDEGPIQHQPKQSFLNNALDYEKSLALGLAQGAGDVGASIGNFPSDIYKHFTGTQPYHIPHPTLQQYYSKNGAGNLGSSIGESVGNMVGPGGIAFKALRAFNNPLAKALMGSGVGGALGAASNEQDRVGSGVTGAALGGGTALAQSLLKGLNGITTSGIAKKISADKSAAKKMASKEYGNLFSEAANRGLDKVKVPDINAKRIISQSLPRYHEALLNFKKNPTVETAHWAQSDLGALKRQFEKLDASRGLTSTEHKTYKSVIDAQDKIKKSMFSNGLDNHPDLSEKYNKLSGKYKETVIPYESLKQLRNYEQGKLLPKDLIEHLKNNKEFKATLMQKYPGIKINQMLKGKGAKLLGGSILTGLGFEGGKKFMH